MVWQDICEEGSTFNSFPENTSTQCLTAMHELLKQLPHYSEKGDKEHCQEQTPFSQEQEAPQPHAGA